MLYWVIAPIVLILATMLFYCWYIMWKYQYVFVVTRTFESGGLFWYKLYRYSMLGLMAGTITFMTYMGIKEGVSQGPLLVPLPILIYMAWRYTERRFRHQSKNLAFGTALKQERNYSDSDLAAMVSGSDAHEHVQGPLHPHHASGQTGAAAASGASAAVGASVDASQDPESARPPVDHSPSQHHHHRSTSQSSIASTITSNTAGTGHSSVLLKFRENFMKQPNLLCPSKIYPYPYRLYDIPLLDKYGTLNEIYLEDIPEGVDPATLFPENAIPSYHHVSVNVTEDSGNYGGGSGGGSGRASAAAELLAPLSLSLGSGSGVGSSLGGSGGSGNAGVARERDGEADALLQL
jgi:hypothetical protein